MPRFTSTRAALALLACLAALAALPLVAGCGGDSEAAAETDSLAVFATGTVLADIAQNVAGDRFTVEALVPRDADMHAYEPSTRDLARVSEADLFILNGGGLEEALEGTLRSVAPETTFAVAAEGLAQRTPQPSEPLHDHDGEEVEHEEEPARDGDPHFWLDPTRVVKYVENIRDAFSEADPDGAAQYRANAAAYIAELEDLDAWIESEVATLPEERRVLIMNHVSHGYFADRYGFRIAGAVIPSVSTGASPTAKQLAELTRTIRDEGVPVIFVQGIENPELAEQIAAETGITVVDDLRAGSLTEPDGDAPTYIDMMKAGTAKIVSALGQ
jgi:ABC-type Zn uptake system ZnuABC Zn-binding protein ZnuA